MLFGGPSSAAIANQGFPQSLETNSMSHRVATVPLLFQRVTRICGSSVRHDCDIGAGSSKNPANRRLEPTLANFFEQYAVDAFLSVTDDVRLAIHLLLAKRDAAQGGLR